MSPATAFLSGISNYLATAEDSLEFAGHYRYSKSIESPKGNIDDLGSGALSVLDLDLQGSRYS